ncbi:hypothetical protein HPB52_003330 [Rhipicephalus sanguineus]|uniref:Transposase n=1 Tax=Rhipicephalus sanguineus TaxID=34632 RepID=A0A9D4PFN2_RHISA|nr:hypothetical protein HPB52_003330 [Rhipicephalus sanguineus]
MREQLAIPAIRVIQGLCHPRQINALNYDDAGREAVTDGLRPGPPVTVRTVENVEKVPEKLSENRCHSVGVIAQDLNISKDTVRKIVEQDLEKKKIFSKFVPHSKRRLGIFMSGVG